MLNILTQDEKDFVDELLFANQFFLAIKFARAKIGCGINDALVALDIRKTTLGIDFNGHALPRVSALAALARLQDTVEEKVCVIEGSWDGDSLGWFIWLSAITKQPSARHPCYMQHGLCAVRGIKDQVGFATALGEE